MRSCNVEENLCLACKNWLCRIFAKGEYLKFNRCMPMNMWILLSVMPYK